MITDLLLHDHTRTNLSRFIHQPTHALLLVGEAGMGKGTVGRAVAKELLTDSGGFREDKLLEMQPIKGTFTIDQVRAIRQFVALKSLGAGTIKRAILLHDIHLMNIEAQNALLKLLEEPPSDTIIIMTAIPGDVLLPTIYSRLQKIQLHIPNESISIEYFRGMGFATEDIKRMYLLSGGHTGLLQALISDSTDHPLVQAIETSKTLLTANRYEKMLAVEALGKNREDVLLFLQATKRIVLAALHSAAEQEKAPLVTRWYNSLSIIQYSEEIYKSNPNNKLLLTHIMLNL